METRKEDTRRKIQLGGLIVKAGLADEPAAVLLGLLLSCKQVLSGEKGEAFRRQWRERGDQAFAAEQGTAEKE